MIYQPNVTKSSENKVFSSHHTAQAYLGGSEPNGYAHATPNLSNSPLNVIYIQLLLIESREK
jgi:hypothetical protein